MDCSMIGCNMKDYRKLVTPILILVIISGMYFTVQTREKSRIYQPPYKIVKMETYSLADKATKEDKPISDDKTKNTPGISKNMSATENPSSLIVENLTRCNNDNLDSLRFSNFLNLSTEITPKTRASSMDQVTSAKFTRVTLLTNKSIYHLCDLVYILIEARDSLNRKKEHGGDMFRVKLFSSYPYAAVNADNFIDFHNGTYLAVFRLLWEGQVGLNVLLVHPAEAIPLFVPTLQGERRHKELFKGGFSTIDINGTTHRETTTCSVFERKEPYCNYSNTEIYAPWYCSAPKDKVLNCSHWKTHSTDKSAIQKRLGEELDGTSTGILNRSKSLVYRTERLVSVQQMDNSTRGHYAQLIRPRLPYCKPEGPPLLATNGYFFGDTWYPLNCKIKHFEKEEMYECLSGKTLRIFGDSTSRQIYEFLEELLKCKRFPLDPPRNSSRLEFRCRVNNFTMHFHFHGLPTKGSSVSPSSGIHYTANEIDKLEGNSSLIIFLSFWAHFTMNGMDFYKTRLATVRDALDRLLRRAPDTKVFMKGANTRNYSVKVYQLISSDWIALQFEKALRKFYKDYKQYGYIDTWDITTVQRFSDNIHPKPPVVANFIDRIMTYVCTT